jgi:(4-alkanoyl-5-oxo-2,5-dihydrofuran-3-yl)methyl phosphate reductase
MSKILVTGATGNVGLQLVRDLVSRGQAVRAFARSADPSRFDSRVEITLGDFTDKESLRKALDGVSKMYLLGAAPNTEAYDSIAVDLAKAAGLELIVKQSVVGAQYKSTDISRWHRAGEERMEASGIPYVFLRAGAFDSNAFGWAETVKSHDTVYGALGDTALPHIDPADIAAVAAVVLTTPGHAGKAYELTGPEALTTQQQVDILGSVLGRPLKYVNVPDEAASQSMLGMGMTPVHVNAMIGLIQSLRGYGRIEPTADVPTLLGRAARSFRQWATEHGAAFSKAAGA